MERQDTYLETALTFAPHRSETRLKPRVTGFTVIEVLAVILILGALMAIALPLYLNSVANAARKACRANMQTIATAVVARRLQLRAADYSSIIAGGVTVTNLPDLQTVPICPSGGTYSLEAAAPGDPDSFAVVCSYLGPPAHGTFQPGVDSQ